MATIYDVAKLAKVSPKTAARILAGSSGRKENVTRVKKAAEKLGYIRNHQAASLRSGKSGLIGLLVADITNSYYPSFYQHISDMAIRSGYQVMLYSSLGRMQEEQKALRLFEQNRVEGLILNLGEGEVDRECDEIIENFISRGVPVIIGGRRVRKMKVDRIVLKNQQAVEKATQYLLKTGKKSIAFISGWEGALATEERLEGVRVALKKHKKKLKPEYIRFGKFDTETGIRECNELMKLVKPPDAIVAANDMIAIGVIHALLQLHIKIPEEVAVIGFDDIPMAELFKPSLTTLRQPSKELAMKCIERLLLQIQSKKLLKPVELVYEMELILRESA